MEAIRVSGLNKSYFVPVRKTGFLSGLRTLLSTEKREIRAVKDVSFSTAPGEFVGYIGPNGAGKSTTVKMLAGILHPSSGEILVNGVSPHRQRERLAREIGVVFGHRTQLWWDLPTRDSFDILAAMYDLTPSEYRDFLREFDDLLELGPFLDTPVRHLSLGQRMRAELAASLIHQPKVLFLDEPTIGLDLIAQGRIREFLTRMNRERGVTILLTSHDLRDIEELCERVLVLSNGSLIFDGTLRSLRDRAGLPTLLTVEYAAMPEGVEPGMRVEPGGNLLAGNAKTEDAWEIVGADRQTRTIRVRFDRQKSSAPQVIFAVQSLGEIKDVSLEEPLIEDIVRRLLAGP